MSARTVPGVVVVVAAALLLAGCRTPWQRPPPDVGAATGRRDGSRVASGVPPKVNPLAPTAAAVGGALVADADDPVLASLDGREFRASEVARHFLRLHRKEALITITRLVDSEIVRLEAARLGLTVPGGHLEAFRAELAKDLEREAVVRFGLGTEPSVLTRDEAGLDFEPYLDRRVEEERERWIFSRVIRMFSLERERVELSIIVVREDAVAAEILAKLDSGADFGRLASRHSIHESGTRGGRLPLVPREALDPRVAEATRSLGEGRHSRIVAIDDGKGARQFEIVRVERVVPARAETGPELRAAVEADLARTAVDDFEYGAWHVAVERLYNVKVSDKL